MYEKLLLEVMIYFYHSLLKTIYLLEKKNDLSIKKPWQIFMYRQNQPTNHSTNH